MARPMPQRMQSSRRNIGGGGNNRYADEEYSTSQYSDGGGEHYDDDYYEDEYDDDVGGGYDDYDDDDYDNNNDLRNFRRSSGGAARNNYGGGGGGGGRHRNKAASFHDNRDYNRRRSSDNYDYDDNRGGGRHQNRRGSGGGGGRGRQQHHHRRSNSANNAPSSSLHIMLPGTPKQAQDIIRKYTLGMPLQSLNHMALPPTSPPPGPAREIATLTVANLLPQEYAFVRRSNGQWTFAQVAVKHEQLGQLVFIVNKQGSTKSFKRMEWSGFVRRIKGTERKVTLPPQITASGEQQQQQQRVSSGNQDNTDDQRASPHLAIENGPSTHNNNKNNRSANPSPTPGNSNNNNNKLPDISQMSIKEMKLELTSHNINYESFMDKQEFRNAIIDARAEAVKNALIKEQQQMQEKNLQQQQERLQSNFDGFGNYKDPYDDVPGNNDGNNNNGNNNNNDGGDEAVPISTLDADLSNLAGQTITLQPMNDDEVSELMGDYLLTEYKFQMKVLEKERQKKQQGGNNKLGSINEGGSGSGKGGGGIRNSQMSGSFNIDIEAEEGIGGGGGGQQTHYEKQAFAKSQKWGSLGDSNV